MLESQQRELTKLVQTLVKFGNNAEGMSAICYASNQNDIETIKLLVKNGADINAKSDPDPERETVLLEAIKNDNTETVMEILKLGAPVNKQKYCDNGEDSMMNPITYASARNGSKKMINFLLQNGANPNGILRDVWTPLHAAVSCGNYEAVVALVDAGADVNARLCESYGNYTPLDRLAISANYDINPQCLAIARFLVEHGAIRAGTDHNVYCKVISDYLRSVGR